MAGMWTTLGKFIGFGLVMFVQRHSCDLTTKEVYHVLNNKINNMQFELGVYTADIDTIKETLHRLEDQLTKILSNSDKTTDTEKCIEESKKRDTEGEFDGLVTRVHKTLAEEKKIARDNMKDLLQTIDQYKDTMLAELSAAEQHQNDTEYRFANAIDEIADNMNDISGKLIEGSQKTYKLETELNLTKHGIGSKRWDDWGAWGACTWSCTSADSGRVQSRSRTRPCATAAAAQCDGDREQTESRPCNAVQFAGCIQSSASPDNYAVTYDFADQMAQSTCTALKSGYVSAVRRACSNTAPDCNAICRSLGRTCFNALHVYRGSTVLQRNDVAKKGLKMYRYNTCSGRICGPNFCCCSGI